MFAHRQLITLFQVWILEWSLFQRKDTWVEQARRIVQHDHAQKAINIIKQRYWESLWETIGCPPALKSEHNGDFVEGRLCKAPVKSMNYHHQESWLSLSTLVSSKLQMSHGVSGDMYLRGQDFHVRCGYGFSTWSIRVGKQQDKYKICRCTSKYVLIS